LRVDARQDLKEAIVRHLFRRLLPVLALFATAALADFHTFQIEEVYSNADATVQYVVMHESQGKNGENFWAGHTFTATHGGIANTFTFPIDLPGGNGYLYTQSPTANKRVLIATAGFAALHLVSPDYVIPNGFIATDGVTLNYAGVDVIEFKPLPTDGVGELIDATGLVVMPGAIDMHAHFEDPGHTEREDFTTGTFQPVLGDQMTDPGTVRRVLLCSGKVYYDLAAARKEQDRNDIAIVRVEQLYPLPIDELRAELARFPDAELVWVQEEPANQGGWPFIALNLPEYLEGRPLLRASRRASASPAVGSMSIHEAQQREIVAAAFA